VPCPPRVAAPLEEFRARIVLLLSLLDAKALQAELGVTRATAEAIMRRLPTVQPDCVRKVFVKRSDVAAYIDAMTAQRPGRSTGYP
jgi:hypothetical protein